MKFSRVVVSLPFGLGSAEWQPDPAEKQAAWELYVELVTRVTVQNLEPNEGFVREALNSLYSLFGSTREILKRAGPMVGAVDDSVGGLAIKVLNIGLRPFLSKWHPLLTEWESQGGDNKVWSMEKDFRRELEELRRELTEYSEVLSRIAKVG